MEVALFLSVSGLLFIGIAAGVQNSVWQQRVNDSVQSFAEFLKTVYSQVSNPQGAGTTGGRSDKAIYGKLISFGQGYRLNGDPVPSGEQEIFVYDVIGNAKSTGTGGTLDLLKGLDPNVVVDDSGTIKFAGMAESYTPRWFMAIQSTNKLIAKFYSGTILIVRNPRSGTVNTFMSNNVLQINEYVKENSNTGSLIRNALNNFEADKIVNFCINPDGNVVSSGMNRRNVRLLAGAHNASGVVVVGDEDNACK